MLLHVTRIHHSEDIGRPRAGRLSAGGRASRARSVREIETRRRVRLGDKATDDRPQQAHLTGKAKPKQ